MRRRASAAGVAPDLSRPADRETLKELEQWADAFIFDFIKLGNVVVDSPVAVDRIIHGSASEMAVSIAPTPCAPAKSNSAGGSGAKATSLSSSRMQGVDRPRRASVPERRAGDRD
jgi:hypothetical protein